MLSVLGMIFGLLSGTIPELLKYWKDKKDKEHEREMFKLQMEAWRMQGEQRLEEIKAEADIRESEALYKYSEPKPIPVTGYKVIDFITGIFNSLIFLANGLIRPIVTAAFVAFYGWVKYSHYKIISFSLSDPVDKFRAIKDIWTETDQAIFATVIGHWFGQRMMRWTLEFYEKRKNGAYYNG